MKAVSRSSMTAFVRALVVLSLMMPVLGSPQVAHAATGPLCYVDAGAAGANDGDSWTNAYTDLQLALADPNCSEVWVATGRYTPGTLPSDSFVLRNGLALYGGFAGTETARDQRDPAAHLTVLSGDIDGNDSQTPVITDLSTVTGNTTNSYQVVRSNSVDATAVLDGFTITAGYNGGMYNYGGSPTLTNVTISGNYAWLGGGMTNYGGSPTLTNVTLRDNSVVTEGGGMYNYNGSPALTNVTFYGNSAGLGGGMHTYGGGPALKNVTFSSNSARNHGGGMSNDGGSPALANVTFYSNSAGTWGGGIFTYGGHLVLTNVTFSGNSAGWGGGVYNRNTLTSPTVSNTILWGNAGGEVDGTSSTITDSIVQGGCPAGWTCTNVLSVDPQLGPLQDNGGYTETMALPANSLAIDTGGVINPCVADDQRGVARPQGFRCDMGAYEFIQTGALGNPPAVVNASVPGQGTVLAGQQFTSGFSQLLVIFDQDVRHDGSAVAADNPANYLLVRAGGNGVQTASCAGGVSGSDTAIAIDSAAYEDHGGAGPFEATLSLNGGAALPNGLYRFFVCGTTSITNSGGDELYAGLTDYDLVFSIAQASNSGGGAAGSGAQLPATGFTPNRVTSLPPQTIPYTDLSTGSKQDPGDFWLEVPRLSVMMPIVGVPKTEGGWDVSWLGSDAGWLEGSAYPSWNGNSVITGHVWNADNTPGPFRSLSALRWGDQVIVHLSGQRYIYEVRSLREVAPTDVSAMMKHEELPWLTLVSCKDYNEATDSYRSRILVRAVLVEVRNR